MWLEATEPPAATNVALAWATDRDDRSIASRIRRIREDVVASWPDDTLIINDQQWRGPVEQRGYDWVDGGRPYVVSELVYRSSDFRMVLLNGESLSIASQGLIESTRDAGGQVHAFSDHELLPDEVAQQILAFGSGHVHYQPRRAGVTLAEEIRRKLTQHCIRRVHPMPGKGGGDVTPERLPGL